MRNFYLILHYLSKANTYVLCFFILFLIQNYTIGFILNIFSLLLLNYTTSSTNTEF